MVAITVMVLFLRVAVLSLFMLKLLRRIRQANEELAKMMRLVNYQAGRLGGDEFILLIAGESTRAHGVAECVIKSLGEPYALKGLEVCVGASIGIALFPEDTQDVSLLKKFADRAMYTVRQKGKTDSLFGMAQRKLLKIERFQ